MGLEIVGLEEPFECLFVEFFFDEAVCQEQCYVHVVGVGLFQVEQMEFGFCRASFPFQALGKATFRPLFARFAFQSFAVIVGSKVEILVFLAAETHLLKDEGIALVFGDVIVEMQREVVRLVFEHEIGKASHDGRAQEHIVEGFCFAEEQIVGEGVWIVLAESKKVAEAVESLHIGTQCLLEIGGTPRHVGTVEHGVEFVEHPFRHFLAQGGKVGCGSHLRHEAEGVEVGIAERTCFQGKHEEGIAAAVLGYVGMLEGEGVEPVCGIVEEGETLLQVLEGTHVEVGSLFLQLIEFLEHPRELFPTPFAPFGVQFRVEESVLHVLNVFRKFFPHILYLVHNLGHEFLVEFTVELLRVERKEELCLKFFQFGVHAFFVHP